MSIEELKYWLKRYEETFGARPEVNPLAVDEDEAVEALKNAVATGIPIE